MGVGISCKEVFSIIWTFILVTIGWVIFKSDSITDAYNYLSGVFTHSWSDHFSFNIENKFYVLLACVMFIVEWMNRKKEHGLEISNIKSPVIRLTIYYFLFLLVWCLWGGEQQFIYFQF